MSVFAAQRYALGRAIAMVRDRPLAFLLGVVLAASALALPLGLSSIVWSARPALMQVQPAPEVSVFVSTRAAPRSRGLEGSSRRPSGRHVRQPPSEGCGVSRS